MMATTAERLSLAADAYITMSGISWETFEGIAERTRGGRVTYDDGELEIMSPSYYHESFGKSLADLVAAFCEALGMEFSDPGSTTWKAPGARKGIEADATFYLDAAKLRIVFDLEEAGERDITRFPAPDLVIEIDLRSPAENRADVYAAIGAAEVWEFDGKAVRVRRLNPHGTYMDVDRSGWFPISAIEIARAIAETPKGASARRRWLKAYVAELVQNEPR